MFDLMEAVPGLLRKVPARTRHIYRQIGIEESYWPEALRS